MKPILSCTQWSALGFASILALAGGVHPLSAAPAPLLNDPVDVSADFQNFANTLFLADKLASFDPATASGKLAFQRSVLVTKHAFDNTLSGAKNVEQNEFPAIEYAANPEQPFAVEFATSELKKNSAAVTARVFGVNEGTNAATFEVEQTILAPDGKAVATARLKKLQLAAAARGDFNNLLAVAKPQLWSIETPHLHKLVTTIHSGDTVVDQYETTFGIRLIRTKAFSSTAST